jgi:O-antigen ligase
VLTAVDAAVRRPSLAVAATLLLVCLPSGLQNLTTSLTVADLAAGGVVAAVAIGCLAGNRLASRRGWLPFAVAVASFAVATVTATDVAASARGFIRYAELFVLIPVATAMAVRDRFDVFVVAGAVVGTTVLEGSVGVYQYLTHTGASYAGQYVRAIGTFGAEQILALGALVGYGLLVTLALGLALRGTARIALLATGAALTVPLALSLSRGAWIATAAAVLAILVVHSARLAAAFVATAALAVMLMAASGAGPVADERLASIVSSGSAPDRSVQDRYALWTTAVAIWKDHPVFGAGMKDFADYRDSYAPMSLSAGSDVDDPQAGFRREPLLSPHNQYLMVLSEQGTVGMLAFGGLLGALGVSAVCRRRRDPAAGPLPAQDRFLDLVAPAVLVWTLIDFAYGDIGAGPTGVVVAVLVGLVARRTIIVPRAAEEPS